MHHPGLWFLFPILFYLFFYSYIFFQLSSRRITIDLLKKNWAQTHLIHLCNFFSPNFRNSCTVNSNTKSPDLIKGSNKTMGKLNIDTYPRPSILHIRSAYQQRDHQKYILSRKNDVAIARLLSMHTEAKALTLTWKTKHIGASGLSILVIISPEN